MNQSKSVSQSQGVYAMINSKTRDCSTYCTNAKYITTQSAITCGMRLFSFDEIFVFCAQQVEQHCENMHALIMILCILQNVSCACYVSQQLGVCICADSTHTACISAICTQ